LTSNDHIKLFSKKRGNDTKEKPFGAITVRGGFVEIGPSIHHARIYRIEGKKPVYAMLRVFTHDLLSQRHGDLFSAVIPPQSISMRCAEPKLRKAITTGNATTGAISSTTSTVLPGTAATVLSGSTSDAIRTDASATKRKGATGTVFKF